MSENETKGPPIDPDPLMVDLLKIGKVSITREPDMPPFMLRIEGVSQGYGGDSLTQVIAGAHRDLVIVGTIYPPQHPVVGPEPIVKARLFDESGRGATLELTAPTGYSDPSWTLMVPSTGEILQANDMAPVVRTFLGLSTWPCPCEVCPSCRRNTRDDIEHVDDPHPLDGMATCPYCGHRWWSVLGPVGDGIHPADEAELAAWRRHDEQDRERMCARLADMATAPSGDEG